MTSWYPDGSTLGRVTDSSFAADGRSLLLLLIGGDSSSELLLVTLEDPGEARVAARTAIEPHATHAVITYVAPDDSLLAAEVWHEDPDETVILIPTTGEAITMHDGRLAGFVTDVTVATWPSS